MEASIGGLMQNDRSLGIFCFSSLLTLAFLSLTIGAVQAQQEGRRIVNPPPIIGERLDADLRVERGLRLLFPNAHSVVLQEWEQVGLPPLERLSTEERLRLAIKEFRGALEQRRRLRDYSSSQVYGYLGRAFMLLGLEKQKQAERMQRNDQSFREVAQRYFGESFRHYRLALEHEAGELKYVFAVDLVEAIIASGDLNQAIATIGDFERSKLKPSMPSDHGLLKVKADIYSFQGRDDEAGMIYEEWIKRGNTETKLAVGGPLYQKLLNLKQRTGHPNNLPSAPITINTAR